MILKTLSCGSVLLPEFLIKSAEYVQQTAVFILLSISQGGREKDVLRILRREGTLDTVKDNILDNSVDGSYVNLAVSLIGWITSRNSFFSVNMNQF